MKRWVLLAALHCAGCGSINHGELKRLIHAVARAAVCTDAGVSQ